MRYTDTYVSTAIEAPYFAAMEESLHEIEIILPGEKGNEAKELYWVGLVGIERDIEEEFKKVYKSVRRNIYWRRSNLWIW